VTTGLEKLEISYFLKLGWKSWNLNLVSWDWFLGIEERQEASGPLNEYIDMLC